MKLKKKKFFAINVVTPSMKNEHFTIATELQLTNADQEATCYITVQTMCNQTHVPHT